MNLPETLAPPTNCPHCGTTIAIDGAFPLCPNFNCEYRVYGRLRKYVEVLDVKGAGEETLKQLVRAGRANTPADLFEIDERDFCALERQGPKGFKKFQDGLRAKSLVSPAYFFAALDIEGRGTFEAITAVPGLQSVAQIKEAAAGGNFSLFAKALRVSPERAEDIVDQILERWDEVERLETHLTFKQAGDKLIGKTFCITGKLSRPRRDLENEIKDAGGMVSSSVTSRTTYLVCNDTASTSSKMKKAHKNGTQIIKEEALEEMLK